MNPIGQLPVVAAASAGRALRMYGLEPKKHPGRLPANAVMTKTAAQRLATHAGNCSTKGRGNS